VEPNADMRKIAEQELNSYSNFHSICGDAEHTTLQENCIDCIVSAQAFHWFDVEKFRQECLRIIKRDRKVFLIWNVEDSNDCTNQELDMIFQQYCPDIKKSKGKTKLDDKIRFFFGGRYEYLSFDYPLFLDKEKFISKCLSSSYALTRGDKYYYEFIHALYSLFDKYETNGTIAIRNKTIAFCGSLT